jgi:hypothetical protein
MEIWMQQGRLARLAAAWFALALGACAQNGGDSTGATGGSPPAQSGARGGAGGESGRTGQGADGEAGRTREGGNASGSGGMDAIDESGQGNVDSGDEPGMGPIDSGAAPGPGAAGRGGSAEDAAERLYGVTIDGIEPLDDIVASLQKLAHRPTTRVVFDENVPASAYTAAVKRIHAVSAVMGEILDSFYVKTYTTEAYRSRTVEYLAAMPDDVDIWEIGNEINGEWLGDTATVAAKVTAAYDLVKAKGKTTELTLYYNQDCWEKADHEMFRWTEANIPSAMRSGLDYVLVSYYEDDCNGLQPDWPAVFTRLAAMFPTSRIGFGECGTSKAARKEAYVHRYYGMKIDVPRYVGGYFWWYFRQDMVPYTKPLWTVLNADLQ